MYCTYVHTCIPHSNIIVWFCEKNALSLVCACPIHDIDLLLS